MTEFATNFYTTFAEASKFFFYVVLGIMIIIGWRKRQNGESGWANWIHMAVMANFIIGIAYSGIRMISTDEVNDMLVRRLFAWEAWFNAACASFYFLFWLIWDEWKKLKQTLKDRA